MSEVSISIDRTALSLGPLELFGSLATNPAFGIVRYFAPTDQARVKTMPPSDDIHGNEAIAGSWDQAVLGFDWTPVGAADWAAVKAAKAEMRAAIGQFEFLVTTIEDGAPAEVWSANMGSMLPFGSDGLTRIDLKSDMPVFAVTIPVYPIAGTA